MSPRPSSPHSQLVVWLPALCRQMGIPYCIVRNKARLATLVHQKTATCVCLTEVNKEDKNKLKSLCDNFDAQFNNNAKLLKTWGGGQMGHKTVAKVEKREAALAAEATKKAMF